MNIPEVLQIPRSAHGMEASCSVGFMGRAVSKQNIMSLQNGAPDAAQSLSVGPGLILLPRNTTSRRRQWQEVIFRCFLNPRSTKGHRQVKTEEEEGCPGMVSLLLWDPAKSE